MRQVEKFSERRVIRQEDTPEGSTVLPSSLQFAHLLPYLLAHLLSGNFRGYLLFSFFVVIHSSPTFSQYYWVGFCSARMIMWPRPEWTNIPSLASCHGWSKTERMVQLESDSHSQFLVKNVEEWWEALLLSYCHQERQPWVWKRSQSGRKPAWEPWIQLCLKVAHHWTLQLRQPINYIFT